MCHRRNSNVHMFCTFSVSTSRTKEEKIKIKIETTMTYQLVNQADISYEMWWQCWVIAINFYAHSFSFDADNDDKGLNSLLSENKINTKKCWMFFFLHTRMLYLLSSHLLFETVCRYILYISMSVNFVP